MYHRCTVMWPLPPVISPSRELVPISGLLAHIMTSSRRNCILILTSDIVPASISCPQVVRFLSFLLVCKSLFFPTSNEIHLIFVQMSLFHGSEDFSISFPVQVIFLFGTLARIRLQLITHIRKMSNELTTDANGAFRTSLCLSSPYCRTFAKTIKMSLGN